MNKNNHQNPNYERYPSYDEKEEDEKCRHDSIDYSFLDSFDGQSVWKCCKCGCKFNAEEFETIKEEHLRNLR